MRISKPVLLAAIGVVAAAVLAVVVVVVRSGDAAQLATDSGQSADPAEATPSQAPAAPSIEPSPSATDSATSAQPNADASPSQSTTTVNGVMLPDAQVAPPVGFDQPAQVLADFTARVVQVRAIDGVGQGIGEISGPALAFTVELTNNTGAALSSADAVVNAYGSDTAPVIPLLGDSNAAALPATVEPGQTVSGTYVFNVPLDQRDNMTLTIAFDPAKPTVVFVGKP